MSPDENLNKILLVGNPNTGKSVFFSRLTGTNVTVSNYAGTTVDFSKGKMQIEEKKYEIIDVPGTYSLDPTNRAEEVAVEMLEEGDIVINVIDSTNLERNLQLTFELLEKDVPVIVALNMWDEIEHRGIDIDKNKLEELLGVPVVSTVALTGEGFKELISRLDEAKPGKLEIKDRWSKVGEVVEKVQKIEHRHHTFLERIAEATIKPPTGIPIAILVIIGTFALIYGLGEIIHEEIMEEIIFEEWYLPLVTHVSEFLGEGTVSHDILIGELIEGEIDFEESMGLLTTGIFVPFGVVLPFIITFYFGLSILEDSGYLPRLATLVDNIFHKIGIHGQGIVSVFLGLGCNVPGSLSTRNLETRKQRFIAAALLAIAVPCMAQIAMIFGILGMHGLEYILIVFFTLALLYFTSGFILDKIVSGDSPEIFLEIPPYRRPSLLTVSKKTLMRSRMFIREAIPWLFAGIVLINILYSVGIIEWLGNLTAPIVVGLFGLPKEAISALVIGFLRKDLAVGMLLGLGMTGMQLVVAVTILTIYFPCAATFAVLFKELGIKDLSKAIVIMIITVLIVGTLMRLLLL